VVDDAVSTRRFLRAVLEDGGLDVAGEADNGRSAIEQARDLQPDVVLLDLSMPVADGSSSLEGILQAAPMAQVIVLSGMDPKVAAPLVDAGARGFVPKGLPPAELLERLRAIIGGAVADEKPPAPDHAVDEIHRRPLAVVCEDDPMTRRLVCEVLESCGVAVLAATENAPNLLSVVDLARPEVVVLDLGLEGIQGDSIVSELHRRSPRSIIIVYSAYEERKDMTLAAGAAAFVAKPHFADLAERIRQLNPKVRP
jgi:CheY-like chemotaxis protein